MNKDELRPCIVNFPEVIETYRTAGNTNIQRKITKEAETHKGYFHTWADESYVTNDYLMGTTAGQISSTYGIVEFEDGTVHRVLPEYITFTDRKEPEIKIDSDLIGKMVRQSQQSCYDSKQTEGVSVKG